MSCNPLESSKRQEVTKEPNAPNSGSVGTLTPLSVHGVHSGHLGLLLFWLRSARWRDVARATSIGDRIAQEGTLRPEPPFSFGVMLRTDLPPLESLPRPTGVCPRRSQFSAHPRPSPTDSGSPAAPPIPSRVSQPPRGGRGEAESGRETSCGVSNSDQFHRASTGPV